MKTSFILLEPQRAQCLPALHSRGVETQVLQSQIQHHPSPVWRLSRAARPPLLWREGKDKWSRNLFCDPGQGVNASSPGVCAVLGWGQVPQRLRGASHGVVLSSCCPCREVCGPKPPRATEPALGPDYSKRDRNSLADGSGDQPAALPVSATLGLSSWKIFISGLSGTGQCLETVVRWRGRVSIAAWQC